MLAEEFALEKIIKACAIPSSFSLSMQSFFNECMEHPRGMDCVIHAFNILSDTLDGARAAGVRMSGDSRLADSRTERFWRLAKNPCDEVIASEGKLLVGAVDRLLQLGWKVTVAGAKAQPVQAIEINPHFNISMNQAIPENPIEVVVLSMPDRQKVTTVERDAKGDVVTAKQIETDLAG